MLSIEIKNANDLSKAITTIASVAPNLPKKSYDLEFKIHREKRSKNANDYSWVLQDKIAKVLNRSVDEIHKEMVLAYGVIETYSILKVAFDSAVRMFDYYEILGESSLNGKEFIHVKAGVGTHKYNTSEMAHFIDGVVNEAQALDIETKTPEEIEQIKTLWGIER